MAIQKRHRGTLGDFGNMDVSDLSFKAPEPEPAPAPVVPAPETKPIAKPEPAPVAAPIAAPVVEPAPVAQPIPEPAPVAQPQPVPVASPIAAPVAAPVMPAAQAPVQPAPRRGRPKGIKGAGPKRLNLIAGDTDKVLALQLPSKLIEGLKRFADDHDITMKELIGKTLMKKIGPEYYNN